MFDWNSIYKYISFEKCDNTDFLLATKKWKKECDKLLPDHDVISLNTIFKGIDNVLLRKISFNEFKNWSKVVCSSIKVIKQKYDKDIKYIIAKWENFNKHQLKTDNEDEFLFNVSI